MHAEEENESTDWYDLGDGQDFGEESVGLCHLIHGRLQ
jgi:hypothetical protein